MLKLKDDLWTCDYDVVDPRSASLLGLLAAVWSKSTEAPVGGS